MGLLKVTAVGLAHKKVVGFYGNRRITNGVTFMIEDTPVSDKKTGPKKESELDRRKEAVEEGGNFSGVSEKAKAAYLKYKDYSPEWMALAGDETKVSPEDSTKVVVKTKVRKSVED